MTGKTTQLTEGLQRYLQTVSLREPALLQRLREETAADPMARMQIAPEQGQFMGFLVRALGVRRALEVGVYTGYSALWVALAMPSDGRLVACDVSEQWTAVARRYWAQAGVAGKIDLRLAPALETLDALASEGMQGAFDFAFIDADKTNYDAYYERVLGLLRLGGIMLIDNVLWSGRVADPGADDAEASAIRALNEKIHEDQRVDITMLALADGVTLARKR